MRSAEADFYLSRPPAWIDTGTARIAHRRYGEGGDTLLFIHGWPFSGFIWRKLLPRLAARHTCITVDLPGAGESRWTDGNDFSFNDDGGNACLCGSDVRACKVTSSVANKGRFIPRAECAACGSAMTSRS